MHKKFIYIVRANCDEAKANMVIADFDTLREARRCKRMYEKRRLSGGSYWNVRILRASERTYYRWSVGCFDVGTRTWVRDERADRVFAPRALTAYEPRVRVEPTPLEAYVF